MMLNLRILTILFLAACLPAGASLDSKLHQMGGTWLERWRNALDNLEQFSPEERRDLFVDIIRSQGQWQNIQSDPERFDLFTRAHSALIAIPGHAKYYQDQIEQTRTLAKYYADLSDEERRKMEDEYRERDEDLGGLTNYHGVRQNAFKILGLLPSSENVAVLGHYLEDPEGRDGKDVLGNPIRGMPNCGLACNAMSRLGIEHPPESATEFADWSQYQERVDIWKQWWSEIKSGTRTYRFKGSPIEYGPDGPATPEQIEKARQTRERDEKRAAGHDRRTSVQAVGEKEAETKKPSNTVSILIAAAAAVLVSIVWYVRKKKSAA